MVDEARLQGEEPAPAAPAALPRKPGSHTWREFVFQLATITAGVLIALSVDGVVEWRRERALVREAQAAIRQEVTANFRDLEEILTERGPWVDHVTIRRWVQRCAPSRPSVQTFGREIASVPRQFIHTLFGIAA